MDQTSIDWRAVATGASTVLTALVAWVGRSYVRRIETLERDCATREEVEKGFTRVEAAIDKGNVEQKRTRDELREEMKEHRAESRTTFGRLFERLDSIADRNSRVDSITGRDEGGR